MTGLLTESPTPDQTVPHLELASWRERFDLVAGITTRGNDGTYSLGLWSGTEPVGDSMRRWSEFRHRFGPGFRALAFSRQCHGDRVKWHDGPGEGWVLLEGYDGHATREAGVLLAVSVADCVPVYLSDKGGRAIALVHAGWRGTAAGIVENVIRELSTVAAVSSSDIVIHCGVSICGQCYEVGPEVVLKVTGRTVGGPERLDLRAELARRARALGVQDVTQSSFCTAHHTRLFHSHRAAAGRAGRMIAYLGRPLRP